MPEKEGCARMTRASMKRKAAEVDVGTDQSQVRKKRVVLGDISNLPNVNAVADRPLGKETQKKKSKPNATKSKKALLPVKNQEEEGADAVAAANVDLEVEDPRLAGPYAIDICDYLRRLEVEPRRMPLPDYFARIQKDITPSMRGILVDWLVEVAEEYKLVSDTLYLTVSYIDRFLSLKALNRNKLQLLGVASMHIASKYEEMSPPSVEDLCYITDNTYTKPEVVKMEADILDTLKFEIGSPTIKTFLRRFTISALEGYKSSQLQLEFLGCYLAELSLLDHTCVKFLPSRVAASAVFLANFIIQPKRHPWTLSLQGYTKYRPTELKECVTNMHDLYLSRKGGSLQAVREKYKHHKFKFVANLPSPPEIPMIYFEDV